MPKKKMDHSQVQLAIQYSEQLLDIHGWIRKAEELLAATNVLAPEIRKMWEEIEIDKKGHMIRTSGRSNVQATYFMLIAYAMENYFKAILVHRERKSLRIRLHTSLPRFLNEHDLIKLAHKTNLSLLDVPEEELLVRLSRNSVWAACYPVPIGPSGIRAMQQFSDGQNYLIAYSGPRDFDRIQAFMERLRCLVAEEIGSSDDDS